MKLLLFAILILAMLSSSDSSAQTQTVTSRDGIPISYDVAGSKLPALVFIHGWSCDRSYWNAQRQLFSKNYRTVFIDLAGHGKSGTGRNDWTIEAFGEDVAAVVFELGLDEVILIGHSMGGDVIAEAARQLPGRVKGLVMVDTYKMLGTGRSPQEVQDFRLSLQDNFALKARDLVQTMFVANSDSALVAFVVDDMSSAPPEIALPVLESAFSYSRQMPITLDSLRLPVIAINPDNTPTDLPSMKRYNIEVMIMPGVGHFPMMEDPERFNKMLEIAIRKLNQ